MRLRIGRVENLQIGDQNRQGSDDVSDPAVLEGERASFVLRAGGSYQGNTYDLTPGETVRATVETDRRPVSAMLFDADEFDAALPEEDLPAAGDDDWMDDVTCFDEADELTMHTLEYTAEEHEAVVLFVANYGDEDAHVTVEWLFEGGEE